MTIKNEPNDDLLEYYAQWVRFYHYDPIGNIEPPKYSMEDIEEEIYSRMRASDEIV
jgi:hypothetical protein